MILTVKTKTVQTQFEIDIVQRYLIIKQQFKYPFTQFVLYKQYQVGKQALM